MEIVTFPNSTVLAPGSTAMFRCGVKGSPKPEITWGKEANVLRIGDKISIQEQDPGDEQDVLSQLRVFNIEGVDGGTYWCNATNGFNTHTVGVQLLLFGDAVTPELVISTNNRPPDVENGFVVAYLGYDRVLRVEPGWTVLVDCPASGFSLKQWLRSSGHVIGTRGRRRHLANGTLLIREIRPGDTGVHTCRVENEAGDSVSERIEILLKGG